MQQRPGRIAAFERCRIDERLERGPCLAARLRGAIEAARKEIATADDGMYIPCLRIHRNETPLQVLCGRMGLRDFRNTGLDRLLRLLLDDRIVGRVNAEAASQHLIRAKQAEELTPQFLLEVQP